MLKFKHHPTLLSEYGEEFYHEVLKVLQDNQAYINAARWDDLFNRIKHQEEKSNFFLLSTVVELLSQVEIDFLPHISNLPKYFLLGSGIESAIIPGNVKEVGDQAFAQCNYLTSAVIEEGVKVLGNYAFSDCPQLKTVELPRSLNYIGVALFDNCPDLQEVTYKGPKHFFVQLANNFDHRSAISSLLGDVSLTIHCANGDLLYKDNSFR